MTKGLQRAKAFGLVATAILALCAGMAQAQGMYTDRYGVEVSSTYETAENQQANLNRELTKLLGQELHVNDKNFAKAFGKILFKGGKNVDVRYSGMAVDEENKEVSLQARFFADEMPSINYKKVKELHYSTQDVKICDVQYVGDNPDSKVSYMFTLEIELPAVVNNELKNEPELLKAVVEEVKKDKGKPAPLSQAQAIKTSTLVIEVRNGYGRGYHS